MFTYTRETNHSLNATQVFPIIVKYRAGNVQGLPVKKVAYLTL